MRVVAGKVNAVRMALQITGKCSVLDNKTEGLALAENQPWLSEAVVLYTRNNTK